MKDILNLNLRGRVRITTLKHGEISNYLEVNNAIDPTVAKDVVRHCIAGEIDYSLSQIGVYKAGGLLAIKTVALADITYSGTDRVRLAVLFYTSDFADTLDECRLIAPVVGNFSIITGLSVTKSSIEDMQLIWTIDINT